MNFQVGYGNMVQGIQPSVLEINACDWNKARLIHHISHHQKWHMMVAHTSFYLLVLQDVIFLELHVV